jgi:hypothetical protein
MLVPVSDIEIQQAGGRSLGRLTLVAVGALGRINPRLQVTFAGHPSSYAEVEIDDVTLRLEHRQELLGEGKASPGRLRDTTHVAFEVPTSQRLLAYITASLTQAASSFQLDARLTGRGRFSLRSAEPGSVRLVDDPEPGEWRDFLITSGGATSALVIARSDWYDKVVKQVRGEDFVYLEVAVPRADVPTGGRWRKVLDRLHDAERAYSMGEDAAVFQQLRGAVEALPGYPHEIVASISNAKKRKAVDDLLAKAGSYLHAGRHVSQVGTDTGEFPVDHLDAAFALDLMKVTVAHLSLILGTENQLAQP